MAGTTEVDGEVNESTETAATETTPSNGGSASPLSSPTGVGLTLPDHSPPNPTPPSGVATSPSPTNVDETHAKYTLPTATDADETLTKSPPNTDEVVTSSSDVHAALSLPDQPTPVVNAPGDNQENIIRRPRSSRKRDRAYHEPAIFGAMKQEAILNPTPAPQPAVTTAATPPPREGSTHAVQDQEQTPPPTKKTKRDGDQSGINIGSSSGQIENPPPPSPAETAYSDSQILRNRRDKKGNVRWYYSSAGAGSSSRKGKQLPPPPTPPSPPPWKALLYGPELPYTCGLCEKGFYTIRSLSGHMKAHPGRDWRGVFPPPRYMINRDQAAVVAPAADGGNINEGDAAVEEEAGRAHSSPELQENYDAAPPAAAAAAAEEVVADEELTSGKGIPDLNGPPPPDSEEEDVRDED